MATADVLHSPSTRANFEQTLSGETKNIEEDDSDRKPGPFHPHQVVVPRTITGPANVLNKGAIDWGHHGLLAYGSNTSVFVVDTKNVQLVQTLDKHKSVVKKVLWVSGVESKRDGPPSIQLVSGDATGQIIHWDITSGGVLATLQDGNKPVLGMEWVPGLENEVMLAALHSPYFFIIWDVRKQSKLWKKSFTDTLLSFNFDPFDGSKIAFLCPDCILFVDDFQIGKIPSTNGRKFYISTPRLETSTEETLRGRDRLKKLMKGLVVTETKPKADEVMTVSECIQLVYHKSLRHHLILLYPRDIIVIDLQIYQTIGVVPIERSMSPLIQVVPTRRRDALYCLHESGTVSLKVRRRGPPPNASPDSPNTDLNWYSPEMFLCYEHKCQSEAVRQMKGSKVLGISLHPISEKEIGLLLSSGKVIFLELEPIKSSVTSNHHTLSNLLSPLVLEKSSLRLLSASVLSGINGTITAMKMCPPMTKRNKDFYSPLVAVGTSTGYLYLFQLSYGTVYKELQLHANPIRGLEWTGLNSVISFGYGGTGSSDGARVKNELYLTELRTGRAVPFRGDKSLESPITILRVSPLRQYMIIYLRDGPFELWDLASLTLLRAITKKFPSLTAIEWSPIYSVKSLQSKRKSKSDIFDGGRVLAREHLVLSDNASQLYHFSVEGDSIKDGMKIPPEFGMTSVTSLAFKANQIVLSDSDGSVNLWDLKARSSRSVATNRGYIRYLRFAPGKTNLKFLILFNDGIDVVDLSNNQYEKVAQLKWGRENRKLVDADWANSELVIIATEDGSLRILDTHLDRAASPISLYNYQYVVSCPSLLSPKLLTKMQFILCTQFWKTTPNYRSFTAQDGILEAHLPQVNAQLEMLEINPVEFGKLNVAEKCLKVSEMVGDQYGVDLWTVALYYLKAAAAIQRDKKNGSNSEDLDSSDSKTHGREPESLDTCYDYLMDPSSYQRLQVERVRAHEWKRSDYKQSQRLTERLVLLGETDRAVQLLLETDMDNPNYYCDAIKACLVATIQQTGAAQSTIKLVATNLIANGKIWEGVQLLCLIGKGLDGCRYLVSYGMWESAVWLAKSVLPGEDATEVMKKFADHLAANGDRFGAVLVLISQHQFEKALETLYSQHQVLTAALLLISCQHYDIPISRMEVVIQASEFTIYSQDIAVLTASTELIVAIYSSVHDYLLSIGNLDGARALAGYLRISVN